MAKRISYSWQHATTSRCPECGKHPVLLARKLMNPRWPAFYVCFNCLEIFEIGIGKVAEAEEC